MRESAVPAGDRREGGEALPPHHDGQGGGGGDHHTGHAGEGLQLHRRAATQHVHGPACFHQPRVRQSLHDHRGVPESLLQGRYLLRGLRLDRHLHHIM